MWSLPALVICTLLTVSSAGRITPRLHPDFGLNVSELAAQHGYPLELHDVQTSDGYILGIHRIPHGKTNAGTPNKPVVFMMHGLLSCSADWINIGPEKSLAYKLAELGYDVWMGNARGNAESRRHATLDPDNTVDGAEFWSFSFNEIGRKDLPASIDYILGVTGQEELQYVGYSQGTTSFFVLTSTLPEYNKKIKLATLLAPAAEITHMKHPLFPVIARYESVITSFAEGLGIREILPRTEAMMNLGRTLCDDGKETQELCKMLLFFLGGYDREQLDGNLIPVITTNTPAGSSLRQIMHYGQLINAKEFRNWDYHNETLNVQAYGKRVPPKYDLGQITTPISIFYGENDWLASDTDARNTLKQLSNVVQAKLVDYKMWTHLDFLWAIDVADILYNDVIKIMEQYR